MKKWSLILCLLLISFASLASASPSQTANAASHNDIPGTISLLETTPLYPEPNEALAPLAALSPQDVKVVSVQPGSSGYTYPQDPIWIQIHTTWLGDVWIKLESRKVGAIRPLAADLELAAETPLYDRPYREAASGAVLSPQTVHAKAEFVSPSGFYAIQIETSWLGDQWLIQPELNLDGAPVSLSITDAISPNYGDLMTIQGVRIIRLGDRSFVQGQLVLKENAWNVGRANPKSVEYYVSGVLSLWNETGDVIVRIPYAVYTMAGEGLNQPLLLPADTALSSAVFATLQDTFPRYFGLPVPPSLNLKDPEGKVLLGIQHRKETKDYTVAEAWISGKLPGLHEYKLTLTFYDENHRLLGTSHVRQKLLGPKEEAGPDGGGPNKLIDIVGRGSWSNYKEVTVQVDQVTGIKAQ